VLLVFFIIGFILVSLWTIEGFSGIVEEAFIHLTKLDFILVHKLFSYFLYFGYVLILFSFILAVLFYLIGKFKIYGFLIIIVGGIFMIVVLPFIVFLGFLGYI
jgi:hypothetical protein